MPKIYIKTYGCQMNVYDSDKIVNLFSQKFGFTQTDTPEEADLILFNTCSVREKAAHKLFSDLGRIKHLKKNNPELVVGVGGCIASQEGKIIIKRAPIVDLVFGPQTLHLLLEMYLATKEKKVQQVNTKFYANEKFADQIQNYKKNVSAFLTIMEGCNNFCSYCIVPFTRGREISRPMDEILKEAEILVQNGARELHLLGQNVNSYCGAKKETLANLLLAAAQIPGVERLRFTTSHPRDFDEALIAAFAREPKIVNHLHLPVQSGSNRILELMRRGYTREEYLEKIARLKKVRPNISISSDFIVGFPGETTADFEETMTLAREIQFDTSFSFIYSPRPGTAAAKLEDAVPLHEKKARLTALQMLLKQSADNISQKMLNQVKKVLVLEQAKKLVNKDNLLGPRSDVGSAFAPLTLDPTYASSQQSSRATTETDNQRVVPTGGTTNTAISSSASAPNNNKSQVLLASRTENNRFVYFYGTPNLIGKIIPVKITAILTNHLRGELVIPFSPLNITFSA